MSIVLGNFVRSHTLGKVADFCGVCAKVRPFLLKVNHEVVHFLGVEIGQTRPLEPTRCCRACGTAITCRLSDFASPLAVNEEIDLDDLLVETNPTLADQLRFRAEKWQQFQADALSPSQMQISTFDTQLKETTILDLSRNVTPPLDGRAEELLISVMPFHCYGAIYDRLCAKINRWGQLSEEDRTNLTRKVADFVEARRAETFLDEVAERFPTRARMPITLAVLCLGPVMVLLTFLVFWLLPFQPLPILLAVLFGVMLILASFRMALQIRARWQQRAWLQDVLVSEGMKRGIDFRIVLDILRDWDRFQGQVSNQLSEVRESRFLLAEHLSRLLLRFGLDRTARSGKDRQAAT